MRIVLFTGTDTQFVPTLLKPVLEKYKHEIVAAFISRTAFAWDFVRKRIGFFVRNLYPFCIHPGDLFQFVKRFKLPQKSISVFDFIQQYEVKTQYIDEIRSEQTRQKLAALEPDVFLFCPFDKIAGPKFLAIPRLGTFNVHLGKLPRYRGALSAFWVLRFGDPEAGATMHRAIPELDAGDIVSETTLPVKTQSMHTLMEDTVRAAGPMVVAGLDRIKSGSWAPIPKDGRPKGYHYLPTYRDFREFYSRGCRLI